MLLIDQRFCITPPYRTTRPGTLISPTSVAAVICQALSPALNQEGAVTAMNLLLIWERPDRRHGSATAFPAISMAGFNRRAAPRRMARGPAFAAGYWTLG